MPPEPALRDPWFPPEPDQARQLEHEALAEIGPGHQLAGRTLTALAACSGCDRMIFRADDDTFAIVHLTWTRRPEPDSWPATQCLGGFLAIESAADAHSH